MINTLQLIETTGPGGAETVFLSLLEGVPEDKWPMTPVLTGPGWLKTQVESLGYSPIEEKTGGSFDLRFLRALRRRIRENSIQLVHAHMLGAAVYATLALAGKRVPLVATFHGFPDLDLPGINGALKRHTLRNSSGTFVFVSEALREEAVQRGIVRPERSTVIHNGVDLSAFDPTLSKALGPECGEEAPPYTVGSVGNLRPAKDYGNLIRAAGILHTRSPGKFVFQIVGQRSEPLYSELLALRENLGLDDSNVSFAGFRDDIPKIMAELDCLAISSSSEGFSLVAIQAMVNMRKFPEIISVRTEPTVRHIQRMKRPWEGSPAR